MYLTYTIPQGEKETKDYGELELKLKLNLSAVKLARKKYRDSINYCEQVRRDDKNNQKATYRKALAHLELNEFKEAEEEIQTLVSQKGQQADIEALQAKLTQYVGKPHSESRC